MRHMTNQIVEIKIIIFIHIMDYLDGIYKRDYHSISNTVMIGHKLVLIDRFDPKEFEWIYKNVNIPAISTNELWFNDACVDCISLSMSANAEKHNTNIYKGFIWY